MALDSIMLKCNKSDGKEKGPYNFSHIWVVKQKATNKQTNKQSQSLLSN